MTNEEKSGTINKKILKIFKEYGIEEYIVYFKVDDTHIGSAGRSDYDLTKAALSHLLNVMLASEAIAPISKN